MLLVLGLIGWLSLAASAGGADSEAVPDSTVGWVPDPDGRGTLSLVISCVVTLTLCVWSALHLNVPPPNSTFRQLALEKTKWVLYGIFAPELVVATAAAQYITARWLKHQIEKDAAYRRSRKDGLSSYTWSITQCFYAVMGGFVTDIPWLDEDGVSKPQRVTITASGFRFLSFIGNLPKIDEFQIQDKSKADWMAKSIVCVQAGWMVAQVIGRLIDNLPVSLLEINTCGHVACAMILYLLWWSKPFDVQEPSFLDQDAAALALMYLCSRISAVNDGINDIRCFHLDVGGKLPAKEGKPDDLSMKRSLSFYTTILSIGSPGKCDPSQFIGVDGTTVATTERSTPSFNRGYSYKYHIDTRIAPECKRYLEAPYKDLSIRHGPLYCRRKFLSSRNVEAFRPLPATLLAQASETANKLWNECLCRKEYRPYYFTEVPNFGDSGFFLGETEYLARYTVNFPSLSNLSLGQVNLHRDTLRSVLALTAFAYGGLHLSAWNDFFPSRVEQFLWIAAALTIASSGALLWGFFLLRQVWPAFDEFISGNAVRSSSRDPEGENRRQWMRKSRRGPSKTLRAALLTTKAWALYPIGVAFVVSRIFLVLEAFVSLREVPEDMYLTPEWTDFVPHL